jgi:Fe-S cluster assembly protein SufD
MTAVVDTTDISAPARTAGAVSFATTGLPTQKLEDWRFTPLGDLATATFTVAPAATVEAAALAPYLFGHDEWTRLVFVNGRYAGALSRLAPLPEGVTVTTTAEAIHAGHPLVQAKLGTIAVPETTPFTALNARDFTDGFVVHVPKGVHVEMPIHVVFVTTAEAAGTAVSTRSLIVLEREARASIIENHITLAGDATYFANNVTEVSVATHSWLEHCRLQRESEAAYHMGATVVTQEPESHYRSFSLAMGGKLARHDLKLHLNGADCEALFYGLYLAHGQQLVDNHTTIHHDHPNCRSWQVYKGVLDDRARGVFNGKIFVKPEAQKTDAKQTNRAVLLSETAKIDTKPQLEIFADDVKCTHGATVGFLDDSMRYYLRSRGIGGDQAKRMLTYAFCAEVVAEVAIQPVREALDALVRERCGVA